VAGARRDERGGIFGLVHLLREHGEAVIRDLHVVYGVDLGDAFRPGSTLTWRQLRTLVRGLPADSATRIALDGQVPWEPVQYMLADLWDAVQLGTWVAANHGVKKGEQSKRPPPYPRPGDRQPYRVTEVALLDHQRRMRARKEHLKAA